MDLTKELAAYLRDTCEVKLLTKMNTEGEQVTFAARQQGQVLESIKPLLDQYLTAPERKRGTATVNNLESFIQLTNRNAEDSAVLYAKRDPSKPSLTAVLNYNTAEHSSPNEPRFGDHRVVYPFPLSEEWQAWIAGNGQKMSQADFAVFIENRIADVIAHAQQDGDAISDLGRTLGGSFADPARLMELSRGMQVSAEVQVKQVINLGTGEATIAFMEGHNDHEGKPLRVPSLFVIAIPVFEDGPLYRIGVRLRYRLSQGKVIWAYELYRADKSFKHAFDEACLKARDETTLMLLYGTPEA